MAIKCKNCGGNTVYNIKLGVLQCTHCGKEYKIEDNTTTTYAEHIEDNYDYEQIITSLFQCPECGAEIRSFQEEMTIYCPYCGKQTFLMQKEYSTKPKYIVPFQIDKDELKYCYQNYISNCWFVPDELKNDNTIEKFKGIYIPHWSLTYEAIDELKANAFCQHIKDDEKYTNSYEISAKVSGPIENIVFDASYAFDDAIAQKIAPFYTDEKTVFSEGYMAGFYSDKETIDSNIYEKIAEDIVVSQLIEDIKQKDTSKTYAAVSFFDKENKKAIKKIGTHIIMLPVWFITHRQKERVSYGVVNGQTGKMTMDVPVDKKSFLKFTGILAIILSVIFSLMFSTILSKLSLINIAYISLLFLLFSTFVLYKETNMIHKKINNLQNFQSKFQHKKTMQIILYMTIFISFFFFGWFLKFLSLSYIGQSMLITLLTIPVLIGQILLKIKIAPISVHNEKIYTLISLLVTILGLVLFPLLFIGNWTYYILIFLSSVGILLNSLGCIQSFNYLTTLPIPNFFKRGEL